MYCSAIHKFRPTAEEKGLQSPWILTPQVPRASPWIYHEWTLLTSLHIWSWLSRQWITLARLHTGTTISSCTEMVLHCESKKHATILWLRQMLTDFQNSFTDRLSGKFAIKSLWNIPPHHKCVTTLPCEIFLYRNTKIGLVVFNVRITVSAIYLALWLLFIHCISVLHCSRDLTN